MSLHLAGHIKAHDDDRLSRWGRDYRELVPESALLGLLYEIGYFRLLRGKSRQRKGNRSVPDIPPVLCCVRFANPSSWKKKSSPSLWLFEEGEARSQAS